MAMMNPISQRFRNEHATAATFDAGVLWVFLSLFATSFFHFAQPRRLDGVGDVLKEHTQSRIVRGKSKVRVPEHESQSKVFGVNNAVLIYKVSRSFVPEVFALVGCSVVKFGDLKRSLSPVVAAFLLTRQAALQYSQALQTLPEPFGVLISLSIVQCQQRLKTNVYPNFRALVARWNKVGQVQLEKDIPLFQIALDDNLPKNCTFRDWAMQLDLYVTNPIDIEGSVFQLAAVAVAILHRLEVITALEAGQAAQSSRCSLHVMTQYIHDWVTVRTYWVAQSRADCIVTLAALRQYAVTNALDKGTIRLVNTAEHLLCCRCAQLPDCVREFVSKRLPGTVRQDRCETRPLIGVGNAEARSTPTPTSFGQRVVVNVTHIPKHKVKQLGLLFVWVKSVRVGADQLSALLLCDVTPYRCSGNIAHRADVVGARPQVWQPTFQEREFQSKFVTREILSGAQVLADSYRTSGHDWALFQGQ